MTWFDGMNYNSGYVKGVMYMSRITALSENIWSRIAAGEVVERPASAVKELTENALDAGAKRIRVSLKDGGRLRIVVEDDGSGIAFGDLPLALAYHATSKIAALEDLEHIHTLGYRGEALASLVAVADVEIRSRQEGADSGGLIRTHDGKITEHIRANCPKGTRVQVDNLFSGLPARRKFLKSASGELRRAAVFLREYAVCNPSISFSLEHDGKNIFSTDGSGDRKRVLLKLWPDGAEIQNAGIRSGHLELECWFQSRAGMSRGEVIAFVNGRAVNDPVIKSAVSTGARELSGNWALLFTLEPSLVDVNIHPAKSEVRFRYPNEIYEAVRSAVNSLGSPMPLPEVVNIPARTYTPTSGKYTFRDTPRPSRPSPKPLPEREISIADTEPEPEPEITYMGQATGGYLVYDNNNGLVLIDPHAAHERINYERIKSLAEQSRNVQKLLVPVLLHPTLALEAGEYEAALKSSGFEFANTPQGVELRAVPSIGSVEFEPEALLRASLSALNGSHDGDTRAILWRTWATMACKASVKLTTGLSAQEAVALWRELHGCEQPFVCPHGRPTMIEIKNNDLLRHFGRE